ncbi:MAG TPA: YceI family protein [Gemmatimonadales bacterium]|jgi:polyisoprenoid-binding protein YceI|nr:YceI family protein [Gemmatimonadales bacterium]
MRVLVILAISLFAGPPMVAAQAITSIPDGRVTSGTLSFDGRATAGDFVGTTSTVSGQLTGASDVTGVRGWVEAPVNTLKTGNGRRDKDLNKSMESDKFPVLRFELARVTRTGGTADSLDAVLHGALAIHGVTHDVDLPATVQLAGSTARVHTDFPLNLKDYHIGGLSKMLGMLKMYEDIKVHSDLVFQLSTAH